MKKIISFILAISLILVSAFSTFADEETETVPEEGEGVFELAQAAVSEAEESGAEFEGFIFKLDPSEELDAGEIDGIEAIDQSEGLFTAESIDVIEDAVPGDIIEYIEPDYIMELFSASEPNDARYSTDQWNIADMNVIPLWQAGIEGQDLDNSIDLDLDGNYGNDEIIVAVLDSGLNIYHEDIDNARITGAYNIIDSSADITDEVGHGTFVTGIIMALKDNYVGIAGLGQSIYVMPVKVFKEKTTQTSYVVNALNYVTAQKNQYDNTSGAFGTNVSVINISFGGSNPSESLKTAVDAAIEAGIIVICAAGNSGSEDPIYPAMYALGVGAYGSSGRVSDFSQLLSSENGAGYENKVWITAPGEGVTSTYIGNTSYERKSGTSYSCPEISALAAMCKGVDNSLNHYSFKQILKKTSIYRNSGFGTIDGQDVGFGWGSVDFAAAVEAVKGDSIIHDDGWYEDSNGDWYYYRDNIAVTGWIRPVSKWYYLDGSGKMVTGWREIEGEWYYFNSAGAMQTGWIKPARVWYYLDGSGRMVTGWREIKGEWYYFNSAGAMQTGWVRPVSKWYYLDRSGKMVTGWREIEGEWYYFNSAGAMQTGWVKPARVWYYLDGSGKMVTGWRVIDGKRYYFNSNGALQTER